jgi:hypothetical protein
VNEAEDAPVALSDRGVARLLQPLVEVAEAVAGEVIQ